MIDALYADPTPVTVHIYPSLLSSFVSVIDDSEAIPGKEIQSVLAHPFHCNPVQTSFGVERKFMSQK